METPYQQPDATGHFGIYGGSFVSETLTHAIAQLREAYAKYKDDPAFLAEFHYELKHFVGRPSPVYHADQMRDPIAVYQGDIDQVVPRGQSDEIVASLRARGISHEYTVYEGEGHGWRKAETTERFYASVDRFLRQYVVFA